MKTAIKGIPDSRIWAQKLTPSLLELKVQIRITDPPSFWFSAISFPSLESHHTLTKIDPVPDLWQQRHRSKQWELSCLWPWAWTTPGEDTQRQVRNAAYSWKSPHVSQAIRTGTKRKQTNIMPVWALSPLHSPTPNASRFSSCMLEVTASLWAKGEGEEMSFSEFKLFSS